jgi:hypothetical protein
MLRESNLGATTLEANKCQIWVAVTTQRNLARGDIKQHWLVNCTTFSWIFAMSIDFYFRVDIWDLWNSQVQLIQFNIKHCMLHLLESHDSHSYSGIPVFLIIIKRKRFPNLSANDGYRLSIFPNNQKQFHIATNYVHINMDWGTR